MRLTVVIATLAAATVARAEPARVVLSTDLVDLARETFGGACDFRIAPHLAGRIALGYDNRTYFDTPRVATHIGGAQATVGARGFLGSPFRGPFVDAELQLRRYQTSAVSNYQPGDQTIEEYTDDWRALSPRLLVGFQHTFEVGLSVSAAAGVGYEWSTRADGLVHDNRAVAVGSLRTGIAF